MTTALSVPAPANPHGGAPTALPWWTTRFAGTGAMLKLALRRERWQLGIWVCAICLTIIASFPTLAALYPDEASRVALRSGIAATPAFAVMTGPLANTTLGGLTAWRYGVLGGGAVALMALFTVVRRTRADEESGRSELVAAGSLGRFAPLAAALATAWGACLLIGAAVAVGAVVMGQPTAGSIALGAMLAGPGLVFAAVAAITAQLTPGARAATALAGAALAAAFAIRAAGDTISAAPVASWFSPLGWAQRIDPYGENRWWVLALFAAATAIATATAALLQGRRDLGQGLWFAHLGRATNPRLRSPLALAYHLHLGNLIGWAAGFLALGALTGGMANDTEALLAGNTQLTEIMRQIGGSGALADVLLATMGSIGGLLAAAYGIGAVLRLTAEETAGQAAPILATSVGRGRLMASHLAFAAAGPVVLLALAGATSGLLYGASTGDVPRGVSQGLSSMMVQYPAALTLIGLAAILHGWAPRWTSLSWGALGLSLLLGQLGPVLRLPRAVMELSPFAHTPQLPAAPMDWTSSFLLLAIAALLFAIGLSGYRRRDIHES